MLKYPYSYPSDMIGNSACAPTVGSDYVLDLGAGSGYYALAAASGDGVYRIQVGVAIANWGDFSYGDYVQFVVGNGQVISDTSRIVNVIEPRNGTTTPSTSVSFKYDIFTATSSPYSQTCAVITDINTLVQTETCGSLLFSGATSISLSKTLTSGHAYTWYADLRATSTALRVQSANYTFYVVSKTGFEFEDIDGLESPLDLHTSSTSASSTSFIDYVNIPKLLRTKIPFAYIYQFGTLLLHLDDIPAAQNTALRLTFVASAASSTLPAGLYSSLSNVEMFSTTTATKLIPSSVLSVLYLLQVAVIWVGVAFTCFHIGTRAFNHNAA